MCPTGRFDGSTRRGGLMVRLALMVRLSLTVPSDPFSRGRGIRVALRNSKGESGGMSESGAFMNDPG